MTLTRFLLAWRTTPLHDREVIDALVDPGHAAPSPSLAAALREWPGTYYWSVEPDGRHLVLTRPAAKSRESWAVHILLVAATLFTTTMSGAVIAGALVPRFGLLLNPGAWDAAFFRALAAGLSFSVPLLGILLCHELGHYLTARRYQLDVSPPYFLPGPPAPIAIGTFGAFIRLRTILTDRRQLLDVGAAGPIAGFVVAVPVLWLGLAHSPVVPGSDGGMMVSLGWSNQVVGDSLMTLLLREVTGVGAGTLQLTPMAFAGWMGMFVTMLNLLPMAQLDGGHILFAAAPRAHRRVAQGFWIVIMVLGAFFSATWLIWGIVVLILSRGQLGHPPVLDAYRPLPKSRAWLLWASLLLFVLTFTPAPL